MTVDSKKSGYRELVQEFLYNNDYKLNKNCDYERDRKVLVKLFELCTKFDKITNDDNRRDKLDEYEDRVYSDSEFELTEKEKILLEITKIEIQILKSDDSIIKNYVFKKIAEIKDYCSSEEFYQMIDYIKKKIVELQILCGLDITFYNAAYDLFLELCRNIKISKNILKKIK